LAEVIGLDNRLRVFAAAGYYDLTTPSLSQEYVLNHLDLPPGLEQNITFRRYHAGHQIYTSQDALRQLTDDVRTFVEQWNDGMMQGLGAPNAQFRVGDPILGLWQPCPQYSSIPAFHSSCESLRQRV